MLALLLASGADAAPPVAGGMQLLRQQYVEVVAVVAQEPMARGGLIKAAIEVKIAPGYHVNANPPSEDWLIPTAVHVAGAAGVAVEEVFYPEAFERTFQFWPEPLRVWEGTVVVGVLLKVGDDAELGPHDLELVVGYQACNDEACFAPAEVKYGVPVTVAESGTRARTARSPLLAKAPFPSGR